ncbi:MAG: hypothetical protein WBD31_28405, partial [Rubripirellula sp.]
MRTSTEAQEPLLSSDEVSLIGYTTPCDDDCGVQCPTDFGCQPTRHPFEQLSFLAAIDGAKQPQDYGVNADLGVRLRGQYAGPLWEDHGIGFQIGSAVTWTDNAVRVFELIGEDTSRFQNYTYLFTERKTGVGEFG